jgi:hypothetical protein
MDRALAQKEASHRLILSTLEFGSKDPSSSLGGTKMFCFLKRLFYTKNQ